MPLEYIKKSQNPECMLYMAYGYPIVKYVGKGLYYNYIL